MAPEWVYQVTLMSPYIVWKLSKVGSFGSYLQDLIDSKALGPRDSHGFLVCRAETIQEIMPTLELLMI